MIDIQNLISKESVGVKCKGDMWKICVYCSGLKATDIFVILLNQDGSQSDCP